MSDNYGEHYERAMREHWGKERVHVSVAHVGPKNLQEGMWVMYLPLEITEGADMSPRMSRITGIHYVGNEYRVLTELGVMFLKEGDRVQVVT